MSKTAKTPSRPVSIMLSETDLKNLTEIVNYCALHKPPPRNVSITEAIRFSLQLAATDCRESAQLEGLSNGETKTG